MFLKKEAHLYDARATRKTARARSHARTHARVRAAAHTGASLGAFFLTFMTCVAAGAGVVAYNTIAQLKAENLRLSRLASLDCQSDTLANRGPDVQQGRSAIAMNTTALFQTPSGRSPLFTQETGN